MWIRFFRVSDNTTVKTKFWPTPQIARENAIAFIAINPDLDWEGV